MAEHYQSKHAQKTGGGKVALLIVSIVLGIALVSVGVYALVHFVIMPAFTAEPSEVIPTFAPEPALSVKPTQAPTEPPTEAPTEPQEEALAAQYMSGMSERDKICQLFIVSPEQLTGVDVATIAGDTTKEKLEETPVGGIVYFSQNIEDKDQIKELISGTQSYTKTPLFIAVDEEGGDVARVAGNLDVTQLEPMFAYKAEGEEKAHDNAETIAAYLTELGFNLDFAPVADVKTDIENAAIGDRAYSDDYEEAARLVASAVKGFADGGVLSTLKHFPGHGATAADSHDTAATVGKTAEELRAGELLPFKSGIEAGADMVMIGHLTVTDLDPELPATLSAKVVPQLLREELGYSGITITDSMSMAAVTGYDYDTIVKGIFDADIDIILMPDDLDAYIEAIEKAVDNGTITQAQIDARVKKILALKYKNGIMKAETAVLTEAATSGETTAAFPDPTIAE